jgi:hypothetical protein
MVLSTTTGEVEDETSPDDLPVARVAHPRARMRVSLKQDSIPGRLPVQESSDKLGHVDPEDRFRG